MNDLFQFVKDVTVVNDINMGLPAQKYNHDYDAPGSVNPDDVPDYIEPINPDDCGCKEWN